MTTPSMSSAHDASGRPRLAWMARLNLSALVILAAAFCGLMWTPWRHNPDLSHGFFLPLVVIVLIYESRQFGVRRFLPSSHWVSAAVALALMGSLAAAGLAGLYAAASEWAHPVVTVLLALALSGLMFASLLVFAQDTVRLIPFNWSSFLAATLWVLSAPIPPGTYSRLTLGLQLWISDAVLRTLHLLGIVAIRHGNVIELAQTAVGVEEACSGVRSLVSCVFAGLFFSGCLVRRPWTRVIIIALAAPLALGMNFIRSLVLTLLANSGVSIVGTWHDLTGFGVLAVTAGLLCLLALNLDSKASFPAPASHTRENPTPSRISVSGVGRLTNVLGLAVLMAGIFWVSTRLHPAVSTDRVPDLEAVLPTEASGWNVVTTSDLNRFKDTLRTDHFVQRTYVKETTDGELQVTVYIAYWAPGQASASQVATHTPDACWPGAGWQSVTISDTRQTLHVGDRVLSPAEHRFFVNGDYPQHVWFWHLYDRQPLDYLDPLSPRNVIKLAVRQGFHPESDQLFIRVSSNRPWGRFAEDPLVTEIFAKLRPLGL